MEGDIKNFEDLLNLMPLGWEEKARELGALTRSREIKDTRDLLPMIFLYLTSTPTFGKTQAALQLEESIRLNKNAVYERIVKSAERLNRLCLNICRGSGLLAEKPEWLADRRVRLVDASNQVVYGSKQTDYRLHYAAGLFTLDALEMCLSGAGQGERAGNFGCFGSGDVSIGNRAYGTIQGMKYLRERGSGFVFRLEGPGVHRIYGGGGQNGPCGLF
jgi:hypothetical protein